MASFRGTGLPRPTFGVFRRIVVHLRGCVCVCTCHGVWWGGEVRDDYYRLSRPCVSCDGASFEMTNPVNEYNVVEKSCCCYAMSRTHHVTYGVGKA